MFLLTVIGENGDFYVQIYFNWIFHLIRQFALLNIKSNSFRKKKNNLFSGQRIKHHLFDTVTLSSRPRDMASRFVCGEADLRHLRLVL
jgi:hypothetical protein